VITGHNRESKYITAHYLQYSLLDEPTCTQSSHGLVSLLISQLADSDFFKSQKYYNISVHKTKTKH